MNIFLDGSSDRKVVSALSRCRSSENEGLLLLFKQTLEETKSSLIEADGDRFRQLQGRAKVLQDFLEAVDKAPSILERLR
jgi:hypothetical protein